MNDLATKLFAALSDGMETNARHAASRVRSLVGAGSLTPGQHRELASLLREEMGSLIWSVLGRFDNVGCTLPDGILGYELLAKPCTETTDGDLIPLPHADIRDGEDDYADMWLTFLHERKTRDNGQ